MSVALVDSPTAAELREKAPGVKQHVTRVDHFTENLKEMRTLLSTFVERREYIQRDRRVSAKNANQRVLIDIPLRDIACLHRFPSNPSE